LAKNRYRRNRRQNDKYNYRVNEAIRVPKVRLVGDDLNKISETVGETIEVDIYFSKTILQLQRIYRTNLHIVDDIDYHILHELSLGTKNIDLPKKIFLSSTTINRRKHKLKDFLGITDQSDSALIRKAKELRYV